MVFDVATPDAPRLLGRSPMFGNPVDLIVRGGVAIVVLGDWFGRTDDGAPPAVRTVRSSTFARRQSSVAQ